MRCGSPNIILFFELFKERSSFVLLHLNATQKTVINLHLLTGRANHNKYVSLTVSSPSSCSNDPGGISVIARVLDQDGGAGYSM